MIPRLLDAIAAGADLAIGSRYVAGGGVENWAPWRRAVSRAGCAYARAVLRVPVRDLTSGLKCFRAEALEAIEFRTARARGYAFQVELTYRALRRGAARGRGADPFRERREGESKMTGTVALEAAWRIPALRLQARAAACRSTGVMSTEQLALVRGWDDTRATLRRWRARPLAGGPPVGARQPGDRRGRC